MELRPRAYETDSAESIAREVFAPEFEIFAKGNSDAYRGRSIEIEGNNVGSRRIVLFHETPSSVTVMHVVFNDGYSRMSGALKFMKDFSPPRVWRPVGDDWNGANLFAQGLIEGHEATPEELGDFTPLDEALEALRETG